MFSIVTPSYKQLGWLKLCAASVADQKGVQLEHLVQDGGSGSEAECWAEARSVTWPGLRFATGNDAGMYDAINRGLARAGGEFCAYLNCDEQYLPGALRRVQECFELNPEIDVLFGDAHVVNASGRYVCTRKALLPQRMHTLVSGNLAILSCATFFRKKMLDSHRLYFDSRWRDVGDVLWILSLLRRGVRMGLCGFATSTFTDTGENMNLGPNATAEKKRVFEMAPDWAKLCASLVVAHFRLRRLISGHYKRAPVAYEIYTLESPEKRVRFTVERSTAIWKTGR